MDSSWVSVVVNGETSPTDITFDLIGDVSMFMRRYSKIFLKYKDEESVNYIYIEHIWLPDAVLYDREEDYFVFVDPMLLNQDDYPEERYVPIGVEVVPRTHDVYGTGEAGVMSLKAMSYSTPDEGTLDLERIYWGGRDFDIPELTNYQQVPRVSNDENCTITGTGTYSCIQNDYRTEQSCLYDEGMYYYSTITAYYGPGPYLTGGLRNPAYYATSYVNTSGTTFNIINPLSDFDGIGNTSIILSYATAQSDWKTADTITHSYEANYYPAACVCWRYSTEGTKQGDWYLPAMGECGYLVVRGKAINEAIQKMIDVYGSSIGCTFTISSSSKEYYWWSSTEYSSTYSPYCGTNLAPVGYFSNHTKSYTSSVRAFTQI